MNGYVLPDAPAPADATQRATNPPRLRAYPNPFNPTVQIAVQLDRASHTEIIVYDVRGRRVGTVWRGPLQRGRHTFDWNGLGDDGTSTSSGVYFVRINADGHTQTHKITRIR